MSLYAMIYLLEQDITPTGKKFTAVCIGNFIGDDGCGCPGIRTIARMTGQCARTVVTHVNELVSDGLFERRPRPVGYGRNTPAWLKLLAPPERLRPRLNRKATPEPASRRGANEALHSPSDPTGPVAGCSANFAHHPMRSDVQPAAHHPSGSDVQNLHLTRAGDVQLATGCSATDSRVMCNSRHDSIEESDSESVSESDLHTDARAQDDRFGEFWAAYPHGDGDPEPEARQHWNALLRDGVKPDQLVAAAARYAASLSARPNSWSMQAANWLGKRRYIAFIELNPAPSAAPASSGSAQSPIAPPTLAPGIAPGLAERWSKARDVLRSETGDAAFRSWIVPLTLVSASGSEFRFAVRSRFLRDRIDQEYGLRLAKLLSAAVEITVNTTGERRSPASNPSGDAR